MIRDCTPNSPTLSGPFIDKLWLYQTVAAVSSSNKKLSKILSHHSFKAGQWTRPCFQNTFVTILRNSTTFTYTTLDKNTGMSFTNFTFRPNWEKKTLHICLNKWKNILQEFRHGSFLKFKQYYKKPNQDLRPN